MSTNKRTTRSSPTNKRDAEAAEAARRFGARLREARGRRTLRDLHMESGVSIAYISDLERANLTNPSLATLRKIARALGVSLDYLLGGEGDEQAAPRSLPEALVAFLDGPLFAASLADMALRWRVEPSELRAQWTSLMARMEIAGRRPETEADWLFVFETVRRTIDR